MDDPRAVLCEKLVKIGMPQEDAWSVSIDGGISAVDKEYLKEICKGDSELLKKSLELVGAFYMGTYEDDEEEESN